MFCPKCGTPLPEGGKFCPRCGTPVARSAPAEQPVQPIEQPAQVEQPVAQPEPVANVEPTVAPPVEPTPEQPAQPSEPYIPPVEQPAAPTEQPEPYVPPVEPSTEPYIPPVEQSPEPYIPPVAAEQGAPFVPPVEPQYAQGEQYVEQPAPKKKRGKLIALIAAAVAVVAAVVVCLVLFLPRGGGEDAYAYLSDGRYYLTTNLKKEAAELSATRANYSSYTDEPQLRFSDDGKYVYFYTRCDGSSGTLCRAEVAKLKAGSAANDRLVETIASDVSLYGLTLLPDGSIIYENSSSNLYLYANGESQQIAKSISSCMVDAEGGRLIYTTYGDAGYSLYAVRLDDIANRVKLASGVYRYCFACSDFSAYRGEYEFDWDLDRFYFERYDEENGWYDLYSMTFDGEETLLGEHASIVQMTVDGTLWFTVADGETISLSTFVDDPYAASDAALAEPTTDEFAEPYYYFYKVTDYEPDESIFDLYTSCTHPLYFYGESGWWDYSMEEVLAEGTEYWSEGLVAATQSFVDRFGAAADEDGYIKVTDEVKAALLEIAYSASDTEGAEWKWMWLCYNRYLGGEQIDYEAYYAAYDEWSAAQNRIALREELASDENAILLRTLYRCSDGAVEPVLSDVLDWWYYGDAIVLSTPDALGVRLSIDEIYAAWEVSDALYSRSLSGGCAVFPDSGEQFRPSDELNDQLERLEDELGYTPYASLYRVGDELFAEFEGDLYSAPIVGGKLGAFVIEVEDVYMTASFDGTLYYFVESASGGSESYYDFYVRSADGTEVCAARDTYDCAVSLYADGSALAYTGYSYGGYELTLFGADGGTTLVADGVTRFVRADESTLLYISDGDLYLYDGETRALVCYDASYVWSRAEMEPVYQSGYMY